jgi:hypothetical protein
VGVGEIGRIVGECMVWPSVVSGEGKVSLGMGATRRRCLSPEW